MCTSTQIPNTHIFCSTYNIYVCMWRVHVIDAIPIKMLPLLYISQNEHQGQSSPCFIYMEKIWDRYGGGESKSYVRWSIRVGYIAGKSVYVCNTMKRLSTSARRLRMIHQIYISVQSSMNYESSKKLTSTANSSSLFNWAGRKRDRNFVCHFWKIIV